MYNHADYQKRKVEGARLIVEEATSLAKSFDLMVEVCSWCRAIYLGGPHTLSILANGREVFGQFEDDWLANYADGTDSVPADNAIQEMVTTLLRD